MLACAETAEFILRNREAGDIPAVTAIHRHAVPMRRALGLRDARPR